MFDFLPIVAILFLLGGSACNFQYSKTTGPQTFAQTEPGSGSEYSFAQINTSIIQPKCLGCHTTKKPVLTSYAAVVANLSAIDDAVLVKRTMPKRSTLSNDLQAMLAAWIAAGAPEGAATPAPPAGANSIPRPYNFANFKHDVLDVKCNGCHSTGNTNNATALDKYADVLSVKEWLIPLAIGFDGTGPIAPADQMPPTNSPQLTEAEKAYFYIWAADGYRDENGVPDPTSSPEPTPSTNPSPAPSSIPSPVPSPSPSSLPSPMPSLTP